MLNYHNLNKKYQIDYLMIIGIDDKNNKCNSWRIPFKPEIILKEDEYYDCSLNLIKNF